MDFKKGRAILLSAVFGLMATGCASLDQGQGRTFGQSAGNVIRDMTRGSDNDLIRAVGREAPRIGREIGEISTEQDKKNDRQLRR